MTKAATGRKSVDQQPPEGRCCLEASTAAQNGACARGAMKVRSAGVLCESRKPQEACTLSEAVGSDTVFLVQVAEVVISVIEELN